MEVRSTESDSLVCTSPAALAGFACSLHLDDNKKSFQFSAEQFWPKTLGCKRPDPGLLVTALEEIPASGTIREVLLPLFWKGPLVSEDQLRQLTRILVDLGLLISHVCTQNGLQDLTMPRYGSLSIMEGFSLPLMDLYMDKRPQLNWTPRPFVGDIQINWVYEFPLGVPDCLVKRLLAVGQQSMTDHTYLHRWKYGVLAKYGEVLVCMEVSLDQVNICCRVNAEDGEEDAVRMLWIHLAKHVLPVNHFLESVPGLFYKVGLLPLGQLFYKDKKESSVTFPLQDCVSLCLENPDQISKDHIITKKLNIQKTMPVRDGLETSVSEWLQYLSKQWKPPPKQKYKPRNRAQSSAEQTLKHKKAELKWGDQQSPSVKPDTDHQVEEAPAQEESDKHMVENPGDTKHDTEEPAPDSNTTSQEYKVGEEAMDRDRLRVASAFTAVVMATAVAEYIKGLHEENHGKVSREQVQAATLASKIAIATNDGNIDEAAQGVISAVKSLNPVKVKKPLEHKLGQSLNTKICVVL